ncbi:MAG: response regulator transcription factor [candidate division Zixibacteria bacterium]|nr:response regulator transcription factor [candidate division Zixibacteria bacterium]
MFFEYFWIIIALVFINISLSIMLIVKFRKQEQFQTNEAHANLELINQSLNRLSEITEALENSQEASPDTAGVLTENSESDQGGNREQRVLSMIRQGENPREIGKKLGISRSEIDLLVASEKLGYNRQSNNIRATR